MSDHVMTDLETLGTDPYSPILSIGACRFSMDSDPACADTFYQAIRLESCLEFGLKPSASTVIWWMQQNAAAQEVFTDESATTLPLALDAYTDFLNSRPDTLWANSARFDYGLLAAAYKVCGKELPWSFFREGCYRTIKNLPAAKGIKLVRFGDHHNALEDAISQARHLQEINKKLNLQL